MRATVLRKFTLVDAMVLIAATAIAFVPIRFLLREPYTQLLVLGDPVSLGSIWGVCID